MSPQHHDTGYPSAGLAGSDVQSHRDRASVPVRPGAARIGLLLGGRSSERDVSLRSGTAMADALQRRGYAVVRIDPADGFLPERLASERIDAVVLALHGRFGEDGTVQGLLELMGIPYSGPGVAASAVCMDKVMSKRVFRDAGVPTPPWIELGGDVADAVVLDAFDAAGLVCPVFVKPVSAGSSVGVVRVADRHGLVAGFRAAVAACNRDDGARILVEQAIHGSEVTATLLDGVALPLVEVRPHSGFYDYENKYNNGRTDYLVPPISVSDDVQVRAQAVAMQAHDATRCRGLVRVDMMVDGDGTPWVLEINTIPGMTALSLAPRSAAAAGLSFDDLVERILAGVALDHVAAM
jgi:D-alanine-D-alanine ligase